MSKDDTLDAVNSGLHYFLTQSYRHAAYCHHQANKAGTDQLRAWWLSRAKAMEELLNEVNEVLLFVWRQHPEMRIKTPKELLPPALEKGLRLVVDNTNKGPA